MTDPVPSKERLAELIADYQLRYEQRDCKCDTSDESFCKCCRGVCVCHFDFDTMAALKQLQKPSHEREGPHCSTCACPPYQPEAIPPHVKLMSTEELCDFLRLAAVFRRDDKNSDAELMEEAARRLAQPPRDGQ